MFTHGYVNVVQTLAMPVIPVEKEWERTNLMVYYTKGCIEINAFTAYDQELIFFLHLFSDAKKNTFNTGDLYDWYKSCMYFSNKECLCYKLTWIDCKEEPRNCTIFYN